MNTALFLCVAWIVSASAYSYDGFKPPRHPIEVKLNRQHLLQLSDTADPVNTAEMDDMEGFDLFFGDTSAEWDGVNSQESNDTVIDNVWLPFPDALDNETETITLITSENHTNTLVED